MRLGSVDDEYRAARVSGTLRADRAEQQSREPAQTATPCHEHLGVFALMEKDLRDRTLADDA